VTEARNKARRSIRGNDALPRRLVPASSARAAPYNLKVFRRLFDIPGAWAAKRHGGIEPDRPDSLDYAVIR